MAAQKALLAINVAVCLAASTEQALRPPEHVQTTFRIKDLKTSTLHWYSALFEVQGVFLARMMVPSSCACWKVINFR